MGYNLLINGVNWSYNPPILTFDPNFRRDIQVPFLGDGVNHLFKPPSILEGDSPKMVHPCCSELCFNDVVGNLVFSTT